MSHIISESLLYCVFFDCTTTALVTRHCNTLDFCCSTQLHKTPQASTLYEAVDAVWSLPRAATGGYRSISIRACSSTIQIAFLLPNHIHCHIPRTSLAHRPKMDAQALGRERLTEVFLTTMSPAEADQRGRKRRRSPAPFLTVTTRQVPSGESTTFRGRSRFRSTSRLDGSRNVSRMRDASLSPTRRKIMRIARLIARHRSQSPSRSRSPNSQEQSKKRRQRTRSRGREHHHHEHPTAVAEHFSGLRHEIVIKTEAVDYKQHG